MGTNKLINKLTLVLESDEELDERKRRDALKKLLKKLKAKQERLKEKLSSTPEEDKESIQKKLDLVKAHRIKGIEAIKALKED